MKKILSALIVAALFLSLFALFACEKDEYVAKRLPNESDYMKVFYVSKRGSDENSGTYDAPFATLERARQEVAKYNRGMTSDIAVVIREGVYTLSETFKIGQNDGGYNGKNVIYMAYPGEEVRVSGGVKLSSWKKEGQLYYAEVSAKYIRNMFVNGRRATLARHPNGNDYANLYEWDEIGQRAIGYLSDMKGASAFEAVFYMEWSESIARVESVTKSGDKGIMRFKSPERKIFFERGYTSPPQAVDNMYVYYQNAKEFLDAPGEFYYSASESKLYYYPLSGEDMSKSEVYISNLEKVIEVDGANYVTFKDIIVEHSSEGFVNKQGFSEIQTGHYYVLDNGVLQTDIIGAAVEIKNAKEIHFVGCTVRNTGDGGILFNMGVSDSSVTGCALTNLAAYGVMISPDNNYQTKQHMWPAPPQILCHHIKISNNYVSHVALEFRRSAAIASIHGHDIEISNNEVAYVGYSGISVGWGWSLKEYNCRDNIIRRNDVHHYGLYGSDLGGIYLLNNQPRTVVEENYIHECISTMMGYSSGSPAEGIYLDEGSNNLTVRNNMIAYAGENRNLILYHNTGDNITDEGNRGLLRGDELDQSVIENAGVEKEFRSILPYTKAAEQRTAMIATLSGAQTNTQDGKFGFKVLCKETQVVTGLGRFYIAGNYQKHKLIIYDEDKREIASCTVDMSQGIADRYGYKYAYFKDPVTLEGGKNYYIVSEEHKDGDLFLYTNSAIYLKGFDVLGIAKNDNLIHIKNLNSGFVGINLVLEDK